MHVPTNRFGIHTVMCRFCDSDNTFVAGTRKVCAKCGRVLEDCPVGLLCGRSTVYIRNATMSFEQFCEDNWMTWIDCRNIDGYIWIKEECDVWNALIGAGLPVGFSEYSPHFNGPAWRLAVDGPLDHLIIKNNREQRYLARTQPHKRNNDSMSETFSAKVSPSC